MLTVMLYGDQREGSRVVKDRQRKRKKRKRNGRRREKVDLNEEKGKNENVFFFLLFIHIEWNDSRVQHITARKSVRLS